MRDELLGDYKEQAEAAWGLLLKGALKAAVVFLALRIRAEACGVAPGDPHVPLPSGARFWVPLPAPRGVGSAPVLSPMWVFGGHPLCQVPKTPLPPQKEPY